MNNLLDVVEKHVEAMEVTPLNYSEAFVLKTQFERLALLLHQKCAEVSDTVAKRFFKPMSLADFTGECRRIATKYEGRPPEEGGVQLEHVCWGLLTETTKKDINAVDFDFENWDSEEDHLYPGIIGFKTLDNGMPYIGNWAGGDWEFPVFYAVYFDGVQLRAIVPMAGNAVYTDGKETRALTDEDEVYEEFKPNVEDIKKELEERIKPLY